MNRCIISNFCYFAGNYPASLPPRGWSRNPCGSGTLFWKWPTWLRLRLLVFSNKKLLGDWSQSLICKIDHHWLQVWSIRWSISFLSLHWWGTSVSERSLWGWRWTSTFPNSRWVVFKSRHTFVISLQQQQQQQHTHTHTHTHTHLTGCSCTKPLYPRSKNLAGLPCGHLGVFESLRHSRMTSTPPKFLFSHMIVPNYKIKHARVCPT